MSATQPLAARMRPASLDEIIGQEHLLGAGSPLRGLAASKSSVSVILWGPPGTGKTSIAQAIAAETDQRFVELSATSAGVKEVREVLAEAKKQLDAGGLRTLLFLDEIHRFSKAQQDILLPAVEKGLVSLIGATTENPSFSVNAALNSRSVLLVLHSLTEEDLVAVLMTALDAEHGLNDAAGFDMDAVEAIARSASGDARQALTLMEAVTDSAVAQGIKNVDIDFVLAVAPKAIARYDKDGDQHYDVISAFIKSMRGSDPQGALHWLARMLEAGEDPRFIARRIVVHASEDVGMADPSVLPVAVAAAQAVQLIGMPEARINLAQAVIAVATAPKSPAVMGIDQAIADVRAGRTGEVPMHLRDAHYPGAKALGHGQGYLFPHDFPHGIVAQQYLPDQALGATYYEPTGNGFEHTIGSRMGAIERALNATTP
ncbi:MAG: replication-associated recombination protein A [Mycetocola sp.]